MGNMPPDPGLPGPVDRELLHDIQARVAAREGEALAMLERLVRIQSGSLNKPGLDRMAETLAQELEAVLPDVRIMRFAEYGNMVQAQNPVQAHPGCRLLLVGHMDTVFPADTAFTEFRRDQRKCFGPGVYDMKGGLVVALFALKALHDLGLLHEIPVTMLCNSDEEIGSPGSWGWIAGHARECKAALVFEGGGPRGEVVSARKGRLGMRLTVQGRAGHAARGGPKASAALELAHKIIELEALNDGSEITVNVGRIEGGIGPNSVPESATALVDIRFLTLRGQQQVRQSIARIMDQPQVAGTTSTARVTGGRPPMPQCEGNQRLWKLARSQAALLGRDLPWELRFGVSDANIIAQEEAPVLDGFGPLGDLDHSDREYILTQSIAERAVLAAAVLVGLWREPARAPIPQYDQDGSEMPV